MTALTAVLGVVLMHPRARLDNQPTDGTLGQKANLHPATLHPVYGMQLEPTQHTSGGMPQSSGGSEVLCIGAASCELAVRLKKN